MSSVIMLSSPPNCFAKSPTPVDSSSPLPSTYALLTSQLSQDAPKKFKTANVRREGFCPLSSNRALLRAKVGAENLQIGSPKRMDPGLKTMSPKRFKHTFSAATVPGRDRLELEVENDDPIEDEIVHHAPKASQKAMQSKKAAKGLDSASHMAASGDLAGAKSRSTLNVAGSGADTKATAEDLFQLLTSSQSDEEQGISKFQKNTNPQVQRPCCSLDIEMAMSRKTDWTPTKDTTNEMDEDSPLVDISGPFSAGLINSFGYDGDTAITIPASRYDIDIPPTKRRRVELVEANTSIATNKMLPPKVKATRRPRAPPRKPLTITGLATSNYFSVENGEVESTVLDQLLSTQAQMLDTSHGDIGSEVAKVKALKQQRASKRNIRRGTLASPTSAIKALEEQDTLFGSASQLVRADSPTSMRDTLDAMRRSEVFNISSPVRTQETGPISIESTTPQARTGTSRFTKTRGLWAAAGRDEDNALLHVDAFDIDSIETPDVRKAFAGKDVLLQPSVSHTRESNSPERQTVRTRDSGTLVSHIDFGNIGEMERPAIPMRSITPPMVQARALHTTARAESPRKRTLSPPFLDSAEATKKQASAPLSKTTKKKRTPKKPVFAGLTTEKLQKQIAAYGFKPMKRREQMIAVLEKCWEQKHPPVGAATGSSVAAEDVDDSLKHGDYLSSVHGLANRPVPKEKQTPKPRKRKTSNESAEPKTRKKRVSTPKDPDAPKAVRKSKSKAALSEEKIADIHDLEAVDGNVLTEAAAMALAEAAISRATASRAAATKAKETAKSKAKGKAKSKVPIRSAPSSPQLRASTPSINMPIPLSKEASGSSTTTTQPIDAQITLAITSYAAPASTNHQSNPTWHEKMLLYDPIVLEDLAAWLNTTGLGAIGEDREVSALEVRDWCESRGVCCLWKGGWRGNKVVEKE